jgi:hypothetical protein
LRLEEASASSMKETASLVLEHTLNLGDQDTNNDIRDRARLLRQLVLSQSQRSPVDENRESYPDLAHRLQSLGVDDHATNSGAEEEPQEKSGTNGHVPFRLSKADMLPKLAKQLLLVPKSPPLLPALAPDRSSFLPGTMSHIVNHNAPGYMALPEPHSLNVHADETTLSSARDTRGHNHDRTPNSAYTESGSESSTESRDGDSYGYSDEGGSEVSGSEDSRSNDERSSRQKIPVKAVQSHRQGAATLAPLISMDDESAGGEDMLSTRANGSLDYGLPVKQGRDLDSWLDSPGTEVQGSSLADVSSSLVGYASLSLGPLNPILNKLTLLDYTNGDGLDVKYSYSLTRHGMSAALLFESLWRTDVENIREGHGGASTGR